MTDCTRVRESLSLWAGGDLPGEDAQAVGRHLATCAACRREAEAWHADREAWRSVLAAEAAPPVPASEIAARAAAALPARDPGWRKPRFWAAAAPLAAVLALLVLWRLPATGPGGDGPAAGVSWPELQQTFAGCLERPVPLAEWESDDRAGVLTVLVREPGSDRYVVAECLEAKDLSRLRAYPWAAQRIASWSELAGGGLLVAVCPDPDGDRGGRRRLRDAVLARHGGRG